MRTLQTDRLLLRPLTLDDAANLHELLDLDPEVWSLDPGYSRTLSEREADLRQRLAHYTVFGFGCCAVIEMRTNRLIGQGGLNSWLAEDEGGNRTVEFEVMYCLGSAAWGHGLGSELAKAWVSFAFEDVCLSRLLVGPARNNARSIRVLEKLGFYIADDPLEPNCVLAQLTREEWLQNNK